MQNYIANESHEVCCTCFVGKVANHEEFELLKQYLRLDTEILLDGWMFFSFQDIKDIRYAVDPQGSDLSDSARTWLQAQDMILLLWLLEAQRIAAHRPTQKKDLPICARVDQLPLFPYNRG